MASATGRERADAIGDVHAETSCLDVFRQALETCKSVAAPFAVPPIQLVLLDPLGTVLQTADASSGLAVIEQPAQPGIYMIKLVNVGVGSVSVWTASTPLVSQ